MHKSNFHMDLSGIISISGIGGLFKVIAQSKNGLIVESLIDNKRMPVYASHKVSSLEDISIYSTSEDVPLKDVFAKIKTKESGPAKIDSKADGAVVKAYFKEVFPEHDEDRVFVSDMKKVFSWYNLLLEKGFLDKEPEKEAEENEGEKLTDKVKPKKTPAIPGNKTAKTSAPKASTKGMTKTATVRKTGG